MKTLISFRLRKELDADLIEAMGKINREELKNLARDGLRLILGIKTTKRLEVAERPISVVERNAERVAKSEESVIRSKPSVFVPGQRR